MDFKRLQRICKSIDYYNADDLLQEAYLKVHNRYPINEEFYSIFYKVARNIFLKEKQKEKPIELLPADIEDIEYKEDIYKKALDNFLVKKINSIFADVVELYLLGNNLSSISRATGINRVKLTYIIETAKNEIGIEYIRIASNSNFDNDSII
jgi:DNA-directed RNA polymerase specialized sigma24 family protein